MISIQGIIQKRRGNGSGTGHVFHAKYSTKIENKAEKEIQFLG